MHGRDALPSSLRVSPFSPSPMSRQVSTFEYMLSFVSPEAVRNRSMAVRIRVVSGEYANENCVTKPLPMGHANTLRNSCFGILRMQAFAGSQRKRFAGTRYRFRSARRKVFREPPP